uniref:Uncharacterized protein n=1 Tax=Ananas comosus var. bracteatus TaxID=296719 RepID=A0A6V7PLR1_ANACO|nr:unnamed protein product [Ananas comosus var. bracteatus]
MRVHHTLYPPFFCGVLPYHQVHINILASAPLPCVELTRAPPPSSPSLSHPLFSDLELFHLYSSSASSPSSDPTPKSPVLSPPTYSALRGRSSTRRSDPSPRRCCFSIPLLDLVLRSIVIQVIQMAIISTRAYAP